MMQRPRAAAVVPNLPAVRPSVAIALGGGAARGLGHIPCLEALDELGLRPKLVAGTSIGAIIGVCYAAGMSGREIRGYASKLFQSRGEFMRRLAHRWPGSLYSLWNPLTPAILNGETLLEILLPEGLPRMLEKLELPFLAVSTDFYGEEQVIFSVGPLLPAIAASSALPGLLKPVEFDGRVLIDGGFVNPTPFDVLTGKADIVIAIDVTGGTQRARNRRAKNPKAQKLPNSFDTWIGAAQITLRSIQREKLKNTAPDILIRPEVADFGILDFFKIEEILKAAEPAKDELKRQLEQALSAKISA